MPPKSLYIPKLTLFLSFSCNDYISRNTDNISVNFRLNYSQSSELTLDTKIIKLIACLHHEICPQSPIVYITLMLGLRKPRLFSRLVPRNYDLYFEKYDLYHWVTTCTQELRLVPRNYDLYPGITTSTRAGLGQIYLLRENHQITIPFCLKSRRGEPSRSRRA